MIAQVCKGVRCLEDYLEKSPTDFRMFSRERLKEWLAGEIRRHEGDPLFAQRCKIRELKKLHRHELEALKAEAQRTEERWQASPNKEAIERLSVDIEGAKKAIAGLIQAARERTGEKRGACLEKLRQFEERLSVMESELQRLLENSPAKREFDGMCRRAEEFADAVGIAPGERHLERLLKQRGRDATGMGKIFEQTSRKVVREWIVPRLLRRSRASLSQRARSTAVLSGVTLGCARAEMDYVIARTKGREKPLTVLAVVEVKRNTNDVAGGFETRQENLAWFTGDKSGYDPALYRTKIFRHGHFDQPVVHEERGRKFLFDASSFRLFHKDPDVKYYLDRLFFIARHRRKLLGMRSSEYARFLYRISTDVDFEPENDAYLESLYAWALSIISPLQTKDVIRLYLARTEWAQQFFFVEC